MKLKKVQPKIPNYSIFIPKTIISDKESTEYRVSIWNYLSTHRTYFGTVTLIANRMLEFYDVSISKNRSGGISNIDKFKSYIKHLNDEGYISGFNEEDFKASKNQIITLEDQMQRMSEPFALIRDFEYEYIIKDENLKAPINKNNLLLVLSMIKGWMWIRKTTYTGHCERSKKEKPEIFRSTYKSMATFLGLSQREVSACIKYLEENGFIKTLRLPPTDNGLGLVHGCLLIAMNYKVINDGKCNRLLDYEEYDPIQELKYGKTFFEDETSEDKLFYQDWQ